MTITDDNTEKTKPSAVIYNFPRPVHLVAIQPLSAADIGKSMNGLNEDEVYQKLKDVISGPEYLTIMKPEKPQPFNPYF